MLFGMGVGIVIVTFVFFAALRIINPAPEVIVEIEAVSDAEVIERARTLGMVTIRELPERGLVESSPDNTAGHEAYLEELEILRTHNLELARMLEELGVSVEDINNLAYENTVPDMDGYNEITIPRGLNSYDIAMLFYEHGLVDSGTNFNSFIEANDMTTRLMEGTHYIPEGASYAEILRIISPWEG